MTYEEWKEKEIKEILESTWLTKEEKLSLIKWVKDLKKNVKASVRFYALNMFGKKVNELTPREMYIVLDEVIKTYLGMTTSKKKREELKEVLRDILKKEIRYAFGY